MHLCVSSKTHTAAAAAAAAECSSSSRFEEVTMDEPATSSLAHSAPEAVTDTNCNSLFSGSFGAQCTSREIPRYLDRYSLYQIPKFCKSSDKYILEVHE